jgi:energy-coupling factor transport system ATP-binding protein
MSTQPTLQIENLAFRYRDRQTRAIEQIAFELAPGELLLVAGASGCGKTTLIRAINGLIPRSYKGDLEGRILVKGQDTAGLALAEISQRVGTVLQDPERQILGTKVLNEVAFGLENLGLPRDEIRSRAHAALERLGIEQLANRDTHFLSGGEKQKVALAGVLAMQPDLLLLDEPLASLDPASAREALEIFRSLADGGMSVLLVEHRVEDALLIEPERVMYMAEGKIRYLGAADGLRDQVDYRQVKLPAEIIIEQAARQPEPAPFKPAIQPGEGAVEPLVSFRQVAFSYDENQPVLRGIDLDIHSGEIIAVLGPNGAGKTTLVKHAIGLLKPAEGSVLVRGQNTRQLSVAQIAATLGYVFQSPSHMLFAPTVREELEFGPRNLGHSEEQRQEEVAYALDVMNLSGMEADPPLSLSFGQRKRVSIAAILAMRSSILVMDEPTAGQDYQNYMSFMDSILETPGFEAVLFITHDLDLALIYATRVLLMANGELVADGPPEQVLRDRDRLRNYRMIPTSLLEANLARLGPTERFMRAERLAHLAA